MTTVVSGTDWMTAVMSATEELSTVFLGFSGVERIGNPDSQPGDMHGSYIQLVGEQSVHIGLCAGEAECSALSKSLLGMEEDEEITSDDITDAMGEIANIIAGCVKTRMADRIEGLTLGLPVHFVGHIQCSDHQELFIEQVRIGEIDAIIIALREREA